MDKGRPTGPGALLVLGAVVLALGVGYIHDGTQPLGWVAAALGAGILLFALVALAVKVGVQAARHDKD